MNHYIIKLFYDYKDKKKIELEKYQRSTDGEVREKLYHLKVVQKIRVRLLIVVHTTSGELTRDFYGRDGV